MSADIPLALAVAAMPPPEIPMQRDQLEQRYRFLLAFLIGHGVLTDKRYNNGTWCLRGIYGVDDSGLKGAGRNPEEAIDNAIAAATLDPAAAAKLWSETHEAINDMRIALVHQIDELCDQIERTSSRLDPDEQRCAFGAVDHAKEVAKPYRYNGALQPTRALASAPAAEPAQISPPPWKDEPPDWCTPREAEVWQMGYDEALSSCAAASASHPQAQVVAITAEWVARMAKMEDGCEVGAGVMVDCTPPATSRDKWFYEQGRLAERDPRTHAAEATLRDLRLHEAADHMDWLADRLTQVHRENADVDYIRAARRWSAWLRRIARPAVPPPEQEDQS